MAIKWIVVPILLLGSGHVLAQTDFLGRDVHFGVRFLIPESGEATGVQAPAGSGFQLLPFQALTTSSWPDSVAVGDVSGDGRPDVVLATSFHAGEINDNHVFLFRQDTNGSLLAATTYAYSQPAQRTGLALANLDGLNGLDVVVGGDLGITPFLSTPGGGLLARPVLTTGVANVLLPMALGTMGRTDLVGGNWSTTGYLYLGNGSGGFSSVSFPIADGGAVGFAKGDLDGDGDEDFVYSTQPNYPQPSVVNIVLNNLDGTFTTPPRLADTCAGPFGLHDMGIGDFNGDGFADVVASGGGNLPATCIEVFPGLGGGGFGPAQVLATYQIPGTIVVADIDTNGRDDVIVLHDGWLRIGVYLQNDTGSLGPEMLFPVPYATSYETNALAVADFSGDGCPDVAIADYNSGLVTLHGSSCVGRIFSQGFE